MAQKTSLDRFNNNEKLTVSNLSIFFKKLIHPIMIPLSKTKIGYTISKESKYENKKVKFQNRMVSFLNRRPIIYVCNHTTAYDIPIAFNAIRKHAFLFAGKQPLEPIDETFFNINGTIYVDRKDKEDMKLSKQAMEETLKKKIDILVFPEGTWNLTDSNLMHEMKWGIIEVAQKANALIVPIALDYDYDTRVCRYKIGSAIDVNDMSKKDGITTVRDAVASLRWHLFEKRGTDIRKNIDSEKERQKIMHSIDEYPKLDYEYEKSVVFHSNPTPEEVFEPIKKLKR